MATITYRPLGCHALEALPEGRIFDAEYYHDNILTALVSICPEGGGWEDTYCSCRK
jgi:hypothetical protein